MHFAIWGVTLLCLALWSLATWGLAMLLGHDPSWLADLNPLLLKVPFGNTLDDWLPGWQAMVSHGLASLQAVLLGLGRVGPWLLGSLWALGAACIVATGALFSLLVALVRRATRDQPQSPGAR